MKDSYDKLLNVTLEANVGQIGHHMGNDFETRIIGHFKRL